MGPLIANNPIALQVLGVCSALAVNHQTGNRLRRMTIAVTPVTAFSSMFISMIRHHIPDSVRIIVQMAIIALAGDRGGSAAAGFRPMRDLQTAVGIRRAYHHQLYRDGPRRSLRHEVTPLASFYGWYWQRSRLWRDPDYRRLPARSLSVAASRVPVSRCWKRCRTAVGISRTACSLAPSALFIIGLLIWAPRSWKPEQQEKGVIGDGSLHQPVCPRGVR